MTKAEIQFQKILEGLDFADRARIELAAGEIRQVLERYGDFGKTAIAIVAHQVAEELEKP